MLLFWLFIFLFLLASLKILYYLKKKKQFSKILTYLSLRFMHANGSCFLLKAIPSHSIQSPEVTSKAASNDEELNDSASVKALSAKLSEALLNIRAKEDLVKQHAKVAEEAVSGSSSFSFYVKFT